MKSNENSNQLGLDRLPNEVQAEIQYALDNQTVPFVEVLNLLEQYNKLVGANTKHRHNEAPTVSEADIAALITNIQLKFHSQRLNIMGPEDLIGVLDSIRRQHHLAFWPDPKGKVKVGLNYDIFDNQIDLVTPKVLVMDSSDAEPTHSLQFGIRIQPPYLKVFQYMSAAEIKSIGRDLPEGTSYGIFPTTLLFRYLSQ